MSFDKTGASAYVANNSDEILMSGIIGQAKTASLLIGKGSVMFGVKGETSILKMSTTSVLQDGSTCGRNPLGDIALSDSKIKSNPIKDQQNLCTKTLYNTYLAFQALNKGAFTGEELTEKFAQYIMTNRAQVIAGQIEKVLWQGDTTLSGNLARFNGVIKQKGGTAVALTGADVVLKLQDAVNQTNVDLSENEDFALFVGVDVYNQYKMAVANKNFYHENGENIEMVFGTTTQIIAVPGLNGTNKVVATQISNLVLAMDGENDMDKARFEYLNSEDIYMQDFQFAVGIGIAYPAELVVYTTV